MDAIFLSALNISITATYLILAVLLLRLLLKKAPKWISCLLWGIVALRLVMPFSIESEISLIPSSQTITPTQTQNSQYEINTGIDTFDNAINQIIVQETPTDSSTPPITETPQTDIPQSTTQEQNQENNNKNNNKLSLFDILFIVWVAVIAGMLIFSAVSYIRIYKNVRPSVLYRDNIYYCDNIDSPFILGIIRPKIYVPSDIDGGALEFVIEHENAHLKRRDHLWKPFGFLLLSIYWFNPFLWLSYILLCRDIESACDEKVIKNMTTEAKKGYSAALLNCSVHRRMISACPVAFGEVGVKARIKSVLNYKKPAFWIIAVAIVTSIAVAVCFLTNPKQKDILPFLPLEFSVEKDGAQYVNITLNADGTFSGEYTDWDMVLGEAYPNGSYYVCEFSGKFKDIKVNDDYSYSLTLAKFKTKQKNGEEWVEDGNKYTVINPFTEMNVGNQFLLYKPNTPIANIAEKHLTNWPYRSVENGDKLSCYALANPEYNECYFSKQFFVAEETTVINNYYEMMNGFYEQNQDFYYTIKDIDGNGIKELITKNNTEITVYTYKNYVWQLGSYDFVTGTAQLFESENQEYPGIFFFTVGGSCEHYSYLTLKDNEIITTEKLAEDHYGDEGTDYDKRTWVNISDDKEKIKEAKRLYEAGKEIEFIKFTPIGSNAKNSVTFTNYFFTYTASVLFDEQNNAKSFVVVNKDTGETVQQTDISKFENFTDKPIYAIDVTFDGYVDLLIPCERSASAVYFSAYIYDASHSDAKENNFVYAPSFEEIPNFALDKQNEMILSKRTQSMITSYSMSWYSFGDHDFLLANSLYYEPANLRDSSYSEDEIYFVEESYDTDEKETIVNEFVAASDGVIDPDKTDPKVAPYYENGSFWDLDSDKWDCVFTADDILSGFTLTVAQDPLTLGEVKNIFEPLLNKAVAVEQTIMNDTGSLKYENKYAFKHGQNDYSLITDENFKTLDDVWNYTYTTFTVGAAQRAFSSRLDQNAESPRFLERDGKLYYNRNGHGYKSDFDMDSLSIINQLEGTVIISVDCYTFGDDETPSNKCIFIMVNTPNGWRLANTESESTNIDISDYTQDAIAQSNKQNTVLNAYVDFLNEKTYAKNESLNKPTASKEFFTITDLNTYNLNSGIDLYTFFDLNDDGIPELITEGYTINVFSFNEDGQIAMIYESPAGSSSQKNLLANKKIFWSLTSTGTSYEIASFDKDLNVTVDTYFDGKTEQEGDEESFYHNDKKLTESEFYKLKAEFFAPHFFTSPDTAWYAYNTPNNSLSTSRDIDEMQPETQEIITIDGKCYQSYVASNVDIRYVWVSKAEHEMEATWDWVPVGTKDFYSLDLLGKVNEGRK